MTARLPHRPAGLVRRLASGGAAAALVVGAVLLPAAPAAAQSDTCPTEGLLSPVDVRVASPARGASVTGPSVTVRGTASTLLGELTRIEVSVGDASVARNYASSPSIDFELTVDAADVPPGGATTVRVVACASGARGEDRFTVAYQPRAVATTTSTPRPSTTTGSSSGGATGATTTTAATPAAVIAAGGTQPTTTAPGQTTLAPRATTTVVAGPAPAAAEASRDRPEPVRPGVNADGSVVLSDSPDEGSSRPPLWVGAVVGVSGGIGLLFSATSWRRRHQPPPLEPVDPELVEVG